MSDIKKGSQHKSEAFLKGQQIKAEGFHYTYSPYRDKGTGKEHEDFMRGWNSIK